MPEPTRHAPDAMRGRAAAASRRARYDVRGAVARAAEASPLRGRISVDAADAFGCIERPAAVAALPAREEASELSGTLEALEAALARCPRSAAVIVVNNSADGSAELARRWAREARIPAVVCEVRLDVDAADVGHARRLALDLAASAGAPDAVLLSTDADTRVASGWAQALVAAVDAGAGFAYGPVIDDEARLSCPRARRVAGAERRLARAQGALWRRIVPEAPPDVGLLVGGANLAVSAAAYRAVGGLPPLALGEDRALAQAMVEHGTRVAYAPDARVATSMRREGRVAGGMADTLGARRRGDETCDAALLPTRSFVLRALAFRGDRLGCRSAAALLSARLPRKARGDGRCAAARTTWRRTVELLDPVLPLRLADAEREAGHAETLVRGLADEPARPSAAAAVLRLTDRLRG